MNTTRVITVIVAVLYVLFWLAIFAGIVYLFVLIVKALRKYVNSKEVREEKKVVAKSLGVLPICICCSLGLSHKYNSWY